MHCRHLIRLAAAFVVSTIAVAGIANAKSNPRKISASPNGGPGVAAGDNFVCGTYKGNEAQIKWFASLYESALQKAAPVQSADFIFDDVWVVEDDGTILFSGLNVFDTDVQSFHFAPNVGGGFDITSIPFNFDAALGTNLNLGDDSNITENLAFTFTYFGEMFSQVWVNSNGVIAFGGIVNPSGFFDSDDFFSDLPKIAPYFMDLNPAVSGGVFHKSEATKSTITWNNIPEFGTGNINRLQLVLYDDGSFDVTFNGITSTLAANGQPITYGFHPGGTPTLEIISYSDDLPYSGANQAGVYENYLNITNPLVNEVALMQRFYQNFSDTFFQTVFFTNFVQTMGGFANERNIKNDVTGIGLGIFDASGQYGSNGVLESRCNMNRLAVWPNDPAQRFFSDGNSFLTIMGQEAGHRWGAFVNFRDSTGATSNLILGRSDAHWSYYVDVDHSSLEGGNWELLSGNTYITPTQIDYFGDIDEYTFGLRTPEEVKATFYVGSPTNDLPQNRAEGTPVQNALATGTPVSVTIDDIIAAEGPRTPAEPDENKDLRQGFILIVQNGTTPSQAELDKIAAFRRAWEDYFEVSVDGRITCNTQLLQTPPVAVIKGLVRDLVTQQPIDDILVESLERGFVQFVPGGGRYTFRYMADTVPGPDSVCVTIPVEAPGYLADTLEVCIAYGEELCINIDMVPIPTAIGDDDAPPSVTALSQNHPNPFNPTTTIGFTMAEAEFVRLGVYDVKGRLVRTLVEQRVEPGTHSVTWDGRSDSGVLVGSGVYFARFITGHQMQTRKMVLLK